MVPFVDPPASGVILPAGVSAQEAAAPSLYVPAGQMSSQDACPVFSWK
jgi:hypothetical protein